MAKYNEIDLIIKPIICQHFIDGKLVYSKYGVFEDDSAYPRPGGYVGNISADTKNRKHVYDFSLLYTSMNSAPGEGRLDDESFDINVVVSSWQYGYIRKAKRVFVTMKGDTGTVLFTVPMGTSYCYMYKKNSSHAVGITFDRSDKQYMDVLKAIKKMLSTGKDKIIDINMLFEQEG